MMSMNFKKLKHIYVGTNRIEQTTMKRSSYVAISKKEKKKYSPTLKVGKYPKSNKRFLLSFKKQRITWQNLLINL